MMIIRTAPSNTTSRTKAFHYPINKFWDEHYFSTNFINRDPAVNVKESNDAFVLEIALPGLERKEIEIKTEKNGLVIKANKKVENSDELKFRKRTFGDYDFERKFKVSDVIDLNTTLAKLENGILSITLKKKEDQKPVIKKIEIS